MAPWNRGQAVAFSNQLRSYYNNHLDWEDTPELTDLKAMEALETARKAFDERLSECFEQALGELEKLGYPGVTDPKLKIATKLQLQDGLNHDSAVQYEIPSIHGGLAYRLPEDSNGLGYQNLVSIVFGLMSHRDAWMKVGKSTAGGGTCAATGSLTPRTRGGARSIFACAGTAGLHQARIRSAEKPPRVGSIANIYDAVGR